MCGFVGLSDALSGLLSATTFEDAAQPCNSKCVWEKVEGYTRQLVGNAVNNVTLRNAETLYLSAVRGVERAARSLHSIKESGQATTCAAGQTTGDYCNMLSELKRLETQLNGAVPRFFQQGDPGQVIVYMSNYAVIHVQVMAALLFSNTPRYSTVTAQKEALFVIKEYITKINKAVADSKKNRVSYRAPLCPMGVTLMLPAPHRRYVGDHVERLLS